MGHRINVPNNTGMPIYVGSTMIPAGESRDFEESEVPLHLRPAKPAPVAVAPAADPEAEAKAAAQKALEDLAANPAPEIIAAVPELASEQLTALEALEQGREKPRKTVLEAIAEEILKRAGGGGE